MILKFGQNWFSNTENIVVDVVVYVIVVVVVVDPINLHSKFG